MENLHFDPGISNFPQEIRSDTPSGVCPSGNRAQVTLDIMSLLGNETALPQQPSPHQQVGMVEDSLPRPVEDIFKSIKAIKESKKDLDSKQLD
ncbi:hypothetical protein SD81_031765 [Tolypothrix campylonemoides VB511288]|nr:hypothetical protein SD81_031765 [Tolypothrix campylonemoides VB511288]